MHTKVTTILDLNHRASLIEREATVLVDLNRTPLGLLDLGHRQFQDAILELDLGLISVHDAWEHDRTRKGTPCIFRPNVNTHSGLM
jgi:hypothetical protein